MIETSRTNCYDLIFGVVYNVACQPEAYQTILNIVHVHVEYVHVHVEYVHVHVEYVHGCLNYHTSQIEQGLAGFELCQPHYTYMYVGGEDTIKTVCDAKRGPLSLPLSLPSLSLILTPSQ